MVFGEGFGGVVSGSKGASEVLAWAAGWLLALSVAEAMAGADL